ncbi:TPA: lactonase family protein [Bacillus thuringiensis]|uniref:lactonase family protein n=1 Tax=Bacillus cereus group TaxID=86661 RepID=UPI00103C3CA1|nr:MULTISPECIES: lactonase family protein [Bacillus cereus group]MBJ8201344.1 lactonase family protein [Bacillus cereus]MCU4846928.1 lactonase family protein [Bacillus cereus]MDA2375506.1 lactonase family protein [Bacillus cereus]TBX43989.1 lactonase family protein [Bacillus thuringiensis]HDR4765641.1 lactonase family protein [Bacillus cereus]
MKMKDNKEFIGYVGTYTKENSEGIYKFILDTEAKKIGNVTLAAKLDNPTYVTINRNNEYLYSVVKEGESGGVAAYSMDSHTGELKAKNRQVVEGASPCHISVDSGNHTVVTANYHKGTIESFEINEENGTVNPASSIMAHEGSGPNKERQEKPHAHYAGYTPDEKYVVGVDLGIDKIITYEVKDSTLIEVNSLSVNPGSGPRHIAFHPNGKYAYVMTELSSEVIALTYNSEEGSFTELQYISTLPEQFDENSQGSAIHISSDGRFVYAGNRGHNSIAVYSVDQNSGQLTFVEHTSTEGNWPRDFVLDPTEKFLVATNEKSHNLVLFSRDESTGKLTLLQSDVAVPEPVCVKFLNV